MTVTTVDLTRGQSFYTVEWFDTFFKVPPFDPPNLKKIVYRKPSDYSPIYVGEFLDDTGRSFTYCISDLGDWYSATPKAAWERFVKNIEEGIKTTNNEIEKQQNLLDELVRQKELANRKVGEFNAFQDVAEVSE